MKADEVANPMPEDHTPAWIEASEGGMTMVMDLKNNRFVRVAFRFRHVKAKVRVYGGRYGLMVEPACQTAGSGPFFNK